MNKEDLKILEEVIMEEGIRRDINAMIREQASGKAGYRRKYYKAIGITLVVAAGVASIVALALANGGKEQASKEAEAAQLVSEDAHIEVLPENQELKSDLRVQEEGNAGSPTGQKIDGDAFVSSSELNSTQPGGLEQKGVLSGSIRRQKKESSRSSSVGDGEAIAGKSGVAPNQARRENAKRFSKNNDKLTEKKPGLSSKDDDSSVSSPQKAGTEDPDSTGSLGKRDSIAQSPEVAEDSSGISHMEQKDTAGKENSSPGATTPRKWDFKIGLGYGLVSTGDIQVLSLNNELNYRFHRRFAGALQVNFGRSTQPPAIVNASFMQAGLVLHYSPFGNQGKNDLRLSAGPSVYTISHTYRGSGRTVGGVWVYEYVHDARKALGLNLGLEYRYHLSEQLVLGANLFNYRYLNQDAISGAALSVGFKF